MNSAFIGTDLDEYLQTCHIDTVVIVGLTNHAALRFYNSKNEWELGYKTYIISDATAAFGMTDYHGTFIEAEVILHLSLTTIHDEFATVLNTQQFLQSLV